MAEDSSSLLQFEFRDYFEVVRRRKWTVVGAILLVVVTGVFLSSREQKIYRATSEVLVDTTPDSSSSSSTAKPDLPTEIKLLEGAGVHALAAKQIPGIGAVAGSAVGTKIIGVSVDDASPKRAQDSVNAYVAAYTQFRQQQEVARLLSAEQDTQTRITDLGKQVDDLNNQLEQQLTAVQQKYAPTPNESATAAAIRVQNLTREENAVEDNIKPKRDSFQQQQILLESQLQSLQVQSQQANQDIQVITPPALPTSPIRPKPVQDGVKALAVGAMLGVLLAFLFEYFDDAIQTREDVQRAIGPDIAVVGVVPNAGASPDPSHPQLVSLSEPKSPVAESYRTLRTALHFIRVEEPLATLAITSASLGEGKTTTLANLGVVIAQSGRKVVVLDCDLRRPRAHAFFGLSNEVGFTSVMIGEAPLSVALQPVPGVNHLSLLASGPIPPNPSELLASSRFRDVLELLKRENDVVLIDTPPLLPVTDAAVIVPSCDKVLLIVSAGRSTRKQARTAVELLRQVESDMAGVVLNGVEPNRRNGYYSYYYAENGTARTARMPSTNGYAANGNGTYQNGHAPARQQSRRRG